MSRVTAPPALPAVDERLVMPETRYEVIDGQVVYVSPADPPHASRHSKLSALLEAYVAEGYDAASDMLTRTSATGDMAPDGSIYPTAPDPETGGRRLEEIAFEVVSTERLGAAGQKAAALAGRGVRRVFAVDVARQRAFEWASAEGRWEPLDPQGAIADPVLVLPLPVPGLVGAASADDAVAQALLAKRNPVLMQTVAESEARGEARGEVRGEVRGLLRGKAEAVLVVLRARGLAPSPAEEERVLAAGDDALLERWLAAAASADSVASVLGE